MTEPIRVFKEYYVCIKYFIERDNNRKKMMMDLLRNKNLFWVNPARGTVTAAASLNLNRTRPGASFLFYAVLNGLWPQTDQTWTKFEPMNCLRYWRSFRLDRNDFFPYLGSSPCSSSSKRSVGSFPEQQLAINTSVSRKTLQSSVLRQTVTKRINGIKVDLKRPFIWVRLTC